jgi:hypothetical protein
LDYESGVTISQVILHDATSSCSLAGKGRGPCIPMVVCYSKGVERSNKLCKGVERLDDAIGLGRLDDITGVGRDGEGSNKMEERWGAGALVPWLWFWAE